MEPRSCPNLVALFFERALFEGDRPFLWSRRGPEWRAVTWREAADQALRLALSLRDLGLERGDRVALVSENRPEWLIADLGILTAGCITVPAYTTNTVEDHRHVLANSGAKAAIVSSPFLRDRVRRAADLQTDVRTIVLITPPAPAPGPSTLSPPDHQPPSSDKTMRLYNWAELTTGTEPVREDWAKLTQGMRRTDLACIIHTSGTDGTPRGVMLSHGSILCNVEGACALLEELGVKDDVFLSVLPLSHAYEHSVGQFFPISIGAQIYYVDSPQAILAAHLVARPTISLTVPRLLEMTHRQIVQSVKRAPWLQRKLCLAAVKVGKMRINREGNLPLFLRPADALLDRLVRRKVHQRFGGRLKALVSGSAPLNEDVATFLAALGVPLIQGYGLTEAGPDVSCNPPRRTRLATVGPPLPGVEIRLDEDGEILVRGELVMLGYWADPAASASALRDGWLHTGDIGKIDRHGYLIITDRKKDLIKSTGGDLLSPQRVEGRLNLQPEILQAVVFGDRRSHLVAVLVPDEQAALGWARAHGREVKQTDWSVDADFHRTMAAAVERANAALQPQERIRGFLIAREPFTVNNHQLTPTLKVRRRQVLEAYGSALEELYSGGTT